VGHLLGAVRAGWIMDCVADDCGDFHLHRSSYQWSARMSNDAILVMLKDILSDLRKQQQGSPGWFWVMECAVTELLNAEIKRQELFPAISGGERTTQSSR
jgi:hypothetical protein